MIDYIRQSWELIVLIATGIGAFGRWIYTTKIRKATGDKELMDLVNDMKKNLSQISKQSIENEQIISKLSQKINSYQTALHKLTLLCDIMCGEKEKCKEKIAEVVNALGLDDSHV